MSETDKFELPDGSYSVSDSQDYIEYILKTWGKTNNLSIRIYVKKQKIESHLKVGYYLELLTPEMMKLLGSTKSKIRGSIRKELVIQ